MTLVVGKYNRLTSELSAAARRGQHTVELEFDEVGALVGGLPSSAAYRQWWANSSQVQATAWRTAGFRVESVSMDHRRVRFALSVVDGGTVSDDHQAVLSSSTGPSRTSLPGTGTWDAVGEQVDVRVLVVWAGAGPVVLDEARKPTFGALPSAPGMYRLTFTGRPGQERPRVYLGESDNLRRRLASNYRSPGNSQQTSLRVNAALRHHLASEGRVDLAIATAATVYVTAGGSEPTPAELDLSGKAARLLAENAAIVTALLAGDVDLENLP